MKTDFSNRLLYTFVDTGYLHGRKPEEIADELCAGGSDVIQLRAKTSNVDEIRGMARAILPVTQAAGVPLVINDHFNIARELGSEVCHLGQEDFFNSGYRSVTELTSACPQMAIGLSTHAPADAERAISAAADYIAIGPVFATATKPEAAPVTLEYVRWAAANVKIPWYVIGGISLSTLDQVLAAGAKRICVVSAILNAPSIRKACQEFKRRLQG